jgi:hypothetical protein
LGRREPPSVPGIQTDHGCSVTAPNTGYAGCAEPAGGRRSRHRSGRLKRAYSIAVPLANHRSKRAGRRSESRDRTSTLTGSLRAPNGTSVGGELRPLPACLANRGCPHVIGIEPGDGVGVGSSGRRIAGRTRSHRRTTGGVWAPRRRSRRGGRRREAHRPTGTATMTGTGLLSRSRSKCWRRTSGCARPGRAPPRTTNRGGSIGASVPRPSWANRTRTLSSSSQQPAAISGAPKNRAAPMSRCPAERFRNHAGTITSASTGRARAMTART